MRLQRDRGGGTRPANDRSLLAAAGATLACAAGLLAYAVKVLRDGYLDARPKHAGGLEPDLLLAAEEPLWFYGMVAALAGLAILLLAITWQVVRHLRRRR